jgi:hypothetical protein
MRSTIFCIEGPNAPTPGNTKWLADSISLWELEIFTEQSRRLKALNTDATFPAP